MDTTGKHYAPPRPTFSSKGWERKQGKKGRGSGVGGCGRGMWIAHRRANFYWIALICMSSCIIHRHRFATARNITFILQMLIYVKQLIWETSESSSIKDPATFIFFCLQERDSMCARACVRAPTHDHPFNCVCESVCACIWVCVRLCLDSCSWLYLKQPHGSYLSVRSRCDLNDGSAHNYWITILINRFLAAEIMKTRAAQKVNEFFMTVWCQKQMPDEMQISFHGAQCCYHLKSSNAYNFCVSDIAFQWQMP